MKFDCPTKVYVESNCVLNHKVDIQKMGKKAFIITGKQSAKKNGSLQDVLSCVEDYYIFDEVEENPSVETCFKAGQIGADVQADFVIGIGGGSSMDAAKAIALCIANPNEPISFFYEKKLLKALPLICVPTTCGTGSEVTRNAVLSRPSMQAKGSMAHDVYPSLALVDGKYLKSASSKLIVYTAIDALAHLIESHLHATSNDLSKMLSGYGLSLWKECKPILEKVRKHQLVQDKEYEKLMMTSMIAGMAITHTGTSIPHAMSYDLTIHYHIHHGKACGLYLASFLQVMEQKGIDAGEVLNRLDFSSIEEFSCFLSDCIGDCSISKEDVYVFVDKLSQNSSKLRTCPVTLSKSDLLNMEIQSLTII